MRKLYGLTAVFLGSLVFVSTSWDLRPLRAGDGPSSTAAETASADTETAKAMFAGGCFWSVESDMQKAPGVLDVITGYAGGRLNNPTYWTYALGGHREVVLITYDPQIVTFAGLVEYLLKHIDPTDPGGSFQDRGQQYSPAIFVQSESEKEAAERVLSQINDQQVFRRPLAVAILPPAYFWPAEAYHQDYAVHHARQYKRYRSRSGRNSFLRKHWGDKVDDLQLAGAYPTDAAERPGEMLAGRAAPAPVDQPRERPWESFEKPSPLELRSKLTRMQFLVTQRNETEPAYRNAFWKSYKEGIYVDVVSGEPLFSSVDKFDSGTGWPSFAKPLEAGNLVSAVDQEMGYPRVEVRSKHGDCHLGHVFSDGPPALGGLRFCINSAALRFIPKEQLEEAGYGEYLKLFR